MKKKSVLIDGVIGLVLTLAVSFSYLIHGSFLESLEMKAYDMRSSLRRSLDPAGEAVAIIAIDDDSLARLGRWPWPRTRIAEMLDLLTKAKPKVIGLNILFSEPEQNQGYQEIQGLQQKYEQLVKEKKIVEKKGVTFNQEFGAAQVRLDFDSKLKESLAAAGNVVLPMFFSTGGTVGGKPDPLLPSVSSSALTAQAGQAAAGEDFTLEGTKATTPMQLFSDVIRGVGHVNIYPDFDGVVRREYPAVKYGKQYFPSYALQLALRYWNLDPSEAIITPGKSIKVGKTSIPLDEQQSMLVTFAGGYQSFRYYPFHEVLNGKVSPDLFKDKIVILGPSASGISTLYVTPVAHNLPSVEYVANVIKNLLNKEFLVRPAWAWKLETGALALVGLFIILILPRLKALPGALISAVLVVAIIVAGTYLFVQKDQWIKIIYPSFLLSIGYLVITTKRFIFTEKSKEFVEASAIETNRMLGLSFQGQGLLDQAFSKFRLCPLDEQLRDDLYNLGLDFERKRQYSKAVSVYEHIAGKFADYKDIQDKIKLLKQAAEGAVFGGIGGAAKEGTVMITGGASKPTLGRYEIEKELGRGAMGIVYLGKDPKINRKVAIKTMMLEEGTDAGQVKETKERFFREAESAGTLNHPNIVRIFDAGEEHDVCYIAMELLEGHDFTKYLTKEGRLPIEQAMEYVAQVADALDYAHAQGIVHRDIKPANIMMIKDGTVRVTDFGIARITASSKTATGTVMGTPSYMSPEQVAGKKVDGRSDLFSLGVALFELLAGEKPFKGGDGIGALLFQIANDKEPEPRSLNPQISECASNVIHKALTKSPDRRYQRGSEMAAAIRACLASMKDGGDKTQNIAAAPAPAPAAAPEAVAAPTGPAPAPVSAAPQPVAAARPEEQSVDTAPVTVPMMSIQVPAVAAEPAAAAAAPQPASAPSADLLAKAAEEIAAAITVPGGLAPVAQPEVGADATIRTAPVASPQPQMNFDATMPAGMPPIKLEIPEDQKPGK